MITLQYAGVDYFSRCVFRGDNGRYYKTTANVPDEGLENVSRESQLELLRTLYTTDDFEGEPSMPCWNPDKFTLRS